MKGMKILLAFVLGTLLSNFIWLAITVDILFVLGVFAIGFPLIIGSGNWLIENWE